MILKRLLIITLLLRIVGPVIFGIYLYIQHNHEKEVKRAVDEYISANKIQVVKKIGHSSGHTFGGSLGRTLKDNEGLICRIVK